LQVGEEVLPVNGLHVVGAKVLDEPLIIGVADNARCVKEEVPFNMD
jgi:hypothetical protein